VLAAPAPAAGALEDGEETGPRWGREITYQHYEMELTQPSSNTRRVSSSASTRRSISSGVV